MSMKPMIPMPIVAICRRSFGPAALDGSTVRFELVDVVGESGGREGRGGRGRRHRLEERTTRIALRVDAWRPPAELG